MFYLCSRFSSLLIVGAAGLACTWPMAPLAATIDLGPVWAEVDAGSAIGFDTGWTWYTTGPSRIAFGPGPVAWAGEIGGFATTEFALNIHFAAKPGKVITGYEVTGSGRAGQGVWSSAWMTGSFGAASVPYAFTESNSLTGQPAGGAPEIWTVPLTFGAVPSLNLAGTLNAASFPSTNWVLVGSHQDVVGWEPVYDSVQVQVGVEPVFDFVRVCREGVIGRTESGELVYGTVCDSVWQQVGEQPVYEWQQVQVGQNPIYGEVPDYADVTRGTPASISLDRIDIQVTTVPEPQTWASFALGGGLLAWWMRRRPAQRS